MPPKFKAYLQLARISNLPTVFSNVLVGAALAVGPTSLDWALVFAAIFAVSLFYIAGMALNDLLDRSIDRVERPQRPIPSGTLSVGDVRSFTAICFSGGMLILILWVPWAILPGLALIASITLYNYFHKRWSGSLVFMGLCRALVYIAGAAAVTATSNEYLNETENYEVIFTIGWALMNCAALLAIYIIALTLVAQKEVSGGLGFRRWLAATLVLIPLPALWFMPTPDWRWTLPAMLILNLWLIRSARFIWQSPPRVVPAVLGWLAGISLLDAFFLTLTPFPWLSLVALACFAVTVWGHRRIAGT
ncbi:MAG: UbiA family prenyltransferase [Candidatus Hydrogenedentes bacterium]|nr:UbiA family prenyltransferase [Candidatus Hydrogenedentota bacterium]